MSAGYAIESPNVLFNLVRQQEQSAQDVWAGSASNIHDSKKRKRPEVVVAVGGLTVTVYDVSSLWHSKEFCSITSTRSIILEP